MKRFLLLITIFTITAKQAGYSQLVVADPTLASLIAKLNAEVGTLTIAEKQRAVEEQKKELAELQKIVESNKEFLAYAQNAKQTIVILTSIACLMDEILTLQQLRTKYGFHTCYGNLEYEMFQLRISSQIGVMQGLFKEVLKTSGLEKTKAWKQITEDLFRLKKDMEEEKNDVQQDVEAYQAKEVEMQEKFDASMAAWGFLSGIGKM